LFIVTAGHNLAIILTPACYYIAPPEVLSEERNDAIPTGQDWRSISQQLLSRQRYWTLLHAVRCQRCI